MAYRAAFPGVQRAVRASVASGGGSGTDPNPLYSALDMNTIPFHVGAGAWGAQLVFQTASLPTITSDVNVATGAELSAALAVNGRRATLTANITSGSAQGFDITDNEIVVPNGFLLSGFVIGTFSPATEVTTRLRITKASGDTIGGQVHELTMFGATAQDIIIDGLQLSADTSGNAIPIYIDCPTTTRHAFLRNRIISAVATYGYGCEHLLICGNSAYHDANNTGDGGDWGFRISSPGASIFFQNDVRGNSYAPLRYHPRNGSALQYAWAKSNTFVSHDVAGGRVIDTHDTAGTSGYPNNIDAVWFLDNTFYVDQPMTELTTRDDASAAADYVRKTGSTVYGSNGPFGSGGASDADVTTGNTFNVTNPGEPAWGAAGDPTGIDWTP
jgi:hypothetical protein